MPSSGKNKQLELDGILARFERLNLALDEALTGCEFIRGRRRHRKQRKRRRQERLAPKPAATVEISEEVIKRAASTTLSELRKVLLSAVNDDAEALGAIGYYQLKSKCKLTDEILGLALNELIPSHLRTRHEGYERLYFLRRELRQEILNEARRLKNVA